MEKIKYFFILSRPNNVLIAFLSVWVAALVAGSISPIRNITLAAISAMLITIGANVINDIFDVDIDRINKPHRPIPSGKISKKEAFVFFIIVYLLAWILAAMINITMFLIALVFGILLILYSYKFKRMIIIGNLVVSLATAMAFVYGGLAVNRITGTVFPALFAFFFHFGREIIKDMQDVEGDKASGAITFAIKYGVRASLIFTAVIFLFLAVLTLIPYVLKIYGNIYIILIILGIYPVLFFVLYFSWKSPTPRTLGIMSNILKADMIIGLMAIYFG